MNTAAAAPSELSGCTWPLEQLGAAIDLLARRAGLRRTDSADVGALQLPTSVRSLLPGELGRWIDWASARLGTEAEEVQVTVPLVAQALRRIAPAVLGFRQGDQLQFVLVLRRRGRSLVVLAPDGRERRCAVLALRDALCATHEAPLQAEMDRLLVAARVPEHQRPTAHRALLNERLSQQMVVGLWLLRLPATAPYGEQLWRARLPQKVMGVLGLVSVLYALEILAWRVIGEAALQGWLDLGWLLAWLLLLMSMLPLRSGSQWLTARFSLDAGRLLKQRLLAGSLRMDLDQLRQSGAGQLLARVLESRALEAQGLGGAVGVAVPLMELVLAAWVLLQGAAPGGHLLLLGLWVVLQGALAWRFTAGLSQWTAQRLSLTHQLVESMVGHRTRLVQEQAGRRDADQDRMLLAYGQASKALDGAVLPIAAMAPGGWILLGLLALVPPLLAGPVAPAALGISLGGVLLAHRALGGVSAGLGLLAGAWVAWRQVAPLFRAGAGSPPRNSFVPQSAPTAAPRHSALVDASGLGLRYRPEGEPALRGVDLRIGHGERILLQGGSGGGKSTLAALLVGLRRPQSGLLLLHGLDHATLGEEWHRLATEAPQFHDNHLLTGTLAFNLLMGRRWPAAPADLIEARDLCEELGLGELLIRMPAGLHQRVGETGWQLSHGEKSRVFLARALLQKASLTVLDESFAALDPPTLGLCLQTSLRRTQTLLVIAHP